MQSPVWLSRVRAGGWPIWFWCSQRQRPEITNLLFRSRSDPCRLLDSSSRHHTWTWISNDRFTKKEIDHMLIERRQDFSYGVYRWVECPANTDHRIVISASYRMELVRSRLRTDIRRTFDLEGLCRNAGMQERYAIGSRAASTPSVSCQTM